MDFEGWRNELISEIRVISKRSEIEKLWSGIEPKRISSYEEEVAHVFSDYDIDGFLSLDEGKTGLTPLQTAALRKFRDSFHKYVGFTNKEYNGLPDYRLILEDPKWDSIMKLAAEFISMIEKPGLENT